MSFTYDLATDTGQVRLLIGDTASATALFSDEEIAVFLARQGGTTDAAADACEAAAAKFARRADFSVDGQLVKASQVAARFQQLAQELRARGDNNVGTFGVERIDGYSENIANDSNERSSPRSGAFSYGELFDAGREW